MQKNLFLSLSVVALLGVSTVVHGSWVWYSKDYKTSKPAGLIANGDCLEMMCEHGCVENSSEYEGWCCPNDGNTGASCIVAEGVYADACCQSGVCIDGKCGCEKKEDCEGILECDKVHSACVCPRVSGDQRGTISENNPKVCCFDNYAWNSDNMAYSTINPAACGCPKGSTEYIDQENKKQCCSTSSNVLLNISGGKKACCPSKVPHWDSIDNKCVECLKYKDCSGDWICKTDKTCGCAEDSTPYIDLESSAKCCETKEGKNILVDIGEGKKACCPFDTPYWDKTVEKCVAISCSAYPQAGIADETIYTETLVGKATDGKTDCRCPTGKPFWDAHNERCKSCSEIDATKIYWNKEAQKCVECMANYGTEDLGECTSATKPWCNTNGYTCQPCPSGTYWSDITHSCVLTDCLGNTFKSKDDWSVNLCSRTAIDADYDVYISGSAPYGSIGVCGIQIAHRGHKKFPYDYTFDPNHVYATIKKGDSCGIWVYTNWGTYDYYTLNVRYVRKEDKK